jgi:hypothetical protein
MSDITVTSANVQVGNSAIPRNFAAGEALTVGYCVYISAADTVKHADANVVGGEAAARGIGIVTSSKDGETTVNSGDRCTVTVFGPVEGFSDMTPGEPVYVSGTAGRLDQTKPTGGAYQRAIGHALSATCIFVNPDSGDPDSVA